MATPDATTTATVRCSPSGALQVSNDSASVAAPQPTILEAREPPPAVGETAGAHAMRRDLARIDAANAASYPPPSLNSFRTAAA